MESQPESDERGPRLVNAARAKLLPQAFTPETRRKRVKRAKQPLGGFRHNLNSEQKKPNYRVYSYYYLLLKRNA